MSGSFYRCLTRVTSVTVRLYGGGAACVSVCSGRCRVTACIAPKSATRPLRSAGRGKRMIFAQMAGLLAMPTLLPEGVLSAEGEDAQAVKSS